MRIIKVNSCAKCPCLRSSHSGRCCGFDLKLGFEDVDVTTCVHRYCPLIKDEVLVTLKDATTTVKGYDVDGRPIAETYTGPLSPTPLRSISEITLPRPCHHIYEIGSPGCLLCGWRKPI